MASHSHTRRKSKVEDEVTKSLLAPTELEEFNSSRASLEFGEAEGLIEATEKQKPGFKSYFFANAEQSKRRKAKIVLVVLVCIVGISTVGLLVAGSYVWRWFRPLKSESEPWYPTRTCSLRNVHEYCYD